MPADFTAAFAALKRVLSEHSSKLTVKTDTPKEYTLVGKFPSPFPQHKQQPMWFASVRVGKAYVSFHLMPLYMNPTVAKEIPPALKQRMQGKTCFNFKTEPEPEILTALRQLTEAGYREWNAKKWL
jgi:hypothetical protein